MTVSFMLRHVLSRLCTLSAAAAAGALAVALSASAPAWSQDTDTLPTRVGRISNTSGAIYLAPQDHADDWSPVDINYPVSLGDNVWASEGARTELDFGASQLRMSSGTNVSVANLDDHNLALFVAQGDVIVRVSLLDAGDSAVVDTPTTQVVLVRPGLYRITVSPDQQSTTLTVRVGEATAQVTAGRQQVLAGMTAVVNNGPQVVAEFSAAYPLDAFDTYSASRERVYQQPATNNYVSPQMVGYADLATYGAWQSYPDYGNVWFPRTVAAGWAPYSDGYWTQVPGFGLTWVDRAPWGYAPFHYGRWSNFNGRWGWLPGEYVARPVWAPALVAWTGGGITVAVGGGGAVYGWVPLGWREPYRPAWGCGGNCWDRYNRPYQVDVRDRNNDRERAPSQYANWRVPGAVTAVAGTALIARKPYAAGERVHLTGTALASVQSASSAPPMVKPSPNRIPVVRPGSQGTPKPASAFYANSKPAQMGLLRPGLPSATPVSVIKGGVGDTPGSKGNAASAVIKSPNAANVPLNRVGPGNAQGKVPQAESAQKGSRGAPQGAMTTVPGDNAAPKIIAPQNNPGGAAKFNQQPNNPNAAPKFNQGPNAVDVAPKGNPSPNSVNGAPRVTTQQNASDVAKAGNQQHKAPRFDTESKVNNNQGSHMQNVERAQARVVPGNQAQQQQQSLKPTPQPQPQSQPQHQQAIRTAPPANVAPPHESRNNDEHPRASGKNEKEKDKDKDKH